jgi:hypothetical protein
MLAKPRRGEGTLDGTMRQRHKKAWENDPLGRQPGEYLWDEPHGYNYGAFLRDRQRETSPMMWSALYQQRPAPEEGDYFKAAWLKPCDKLPTKETMRIYGGSTMPSQQMAAITKSISWLELIPKDACICSTAGANRVLQMNGSRPSVTSCLNGSQSAGLRRRVRSVPVLDLH